MAITVNNTKEGDFRLTPYFRVDNFSEIAALLVNGNQNRYIVINSNGLLYKINSQLQLVFLDLKLEINNTYADSLGNINLDDLFNVDVPTPTNGQILAFNTGTSQWEAVDAPSGSGDMTKLVYDTDNDGIVDNSERLNGQLPTFYLLRSNHTGTQTASTISDFTSAARAATVQDSILDTVVDIAPSQNAVFDALALKYEASNPSAYISTISGISAGGELSGTYPNPAVLNSAVLAKVLTGLNVIGASLTATDTIIEAFGKIQNQINMVLGGAIYQGTWAASTNTPPLVNGVGTTGYYYVASDNGIVDFGAGNIDFNTGDWAIYNGTIWEKVDNTDAVTSVNGFIGAVNLTSADIAEVTNLYFTTARVLATTLAGYTSGAGTISSADTILQAIQKLNGNINSLTTADVPDSTNRRYVTDANLVVINNTSGTNSGNETAATIATIGHGATLDTTPLDADEVMGLDSASSFSLIRTTWTSIKAFLKTYFDALYKPLPVARVYTSVSLANNTSRTPSATNDILLVITFRLSAASGQAPSVILQVDDSGGGTFTTIATNTNNNGLTLLGLSGSSIQTTPTTIIIPKTSQYRYVTSGSGSVTVINHFELTM